MPASSANWRIESSASSRCWRMISPSAAEARAAMASRLHLLTAVDIPHLTGDERRVVRGQEVHDARHLVGPAEPSHGDLGLDAVEDLLGDVLDHLGGDEAGRDRVDRET